MIRHSPAEYYVKYLLVHPKRYTDSNIREILGTRQLDDLGGAYLVRLRRDLRVPAPFYPYDPKHSRSQRFLLKERLLLLYRPDDAMKNANQLLATARAKELLESMIFSGSTAPWAASALQRAGFPATSEAVDHFRFYYCNIGLVDSTEMRALIRLRVSHPADSDDPELTAQSAALVKAQYMDARLAAVEMPISPLANLLNMMRMGYMPSNVELSKIASATRTAASIRAYESAIRGGPRDHERSRDYALVAKSMTEMLAAVGSPEEDFQKELSSIMLRRDEAEIPYIHQLSSGRHTVEMQPVEGHDVDSK